MAKYNYPQIAPNGQTFQDHKNQIINDWIAASEQAIDALFTWKAYLRAWQTHPVPDDAFMSAIQDMTEAGLAEWLDASWADIDALRRVVTDES